MAYADQSTSGNRIFAFIVVAVLHVLLGYGLVTGLAFEAAKKVAQRVTTIDIEEPEEPEVEPPPPPPEQKQVAPPPVAPPPPISIAPAPPPIQTSPVILPPPPSAPPPPPPPPKPPVPRGNPGSWAGPDDYPSRALREEREGTTRFTVTVDTNGRVSNCQVTRSSGHADLDEATCSNISRRARFKPAVDSHGNEVVSTWSSAVRWQMPR